MDEALRAEKIAALERIVDRFAPDLDTGATQEWYQDKRDEVQKVLDDADAAWDAVILLGSPSPELREYRKQARDGIEAFVTVLDGFLLDEVEPE